MSNRNTLKGPKEPRVEDLTSAKANQIPGGVADLKDTISRIKDADAKKAVQILAKIVLGVK